MATVFPRLNFPFRRPFYPPPEPVMNASDQLEKAYQEWRTVALAEGEAIRAGNWTAVAKYQGTLQKLQSQILQGTEQARKEWLTTGSAGLTAEKNIQRIIRETMEIVRQNQAALGAISGEA